MAHNPPYFQPPLMITLHCTVASLVTDSPTCSRWLKSRLAKQTSSDRHLSISYHQLQFSFFEFFLNFFCLCSYSFKNFRIIYLCSYSFFLPELILHHYSVEGYCFNQVRMKIGWQILWNTIPFCETFKISCLMGKLRTRDFFFGKHLKDRSSRLVHWLSITVSAKRPVKNPSIWKESLAWIVLWMRAVRGGNLEG